MQSFYAMWDVIVNFIEYSMFYYLLFSQLGYGQKNSKRALLGLLCIASLLSILNFTVSNSNITIAVMFVANVSFAYFCFGKSITVRVLWGCTSSVIAIISNTITFWAASFFTNANLNDILIFTPIRFQVSIIYLLICFLFYTSLAHVKQKDIYLPKSYRILLFSFIVIGIIASDQLLTASINPGTSGQKEVFAGVVYLVILFGVVVLFEFLGILYKRNTDLVIKLQEANLEKVHFKNIEETMETLRVWKHDYHSHLQTIQNLLNGNNLEELQDYLGKADFDLSNITSLVSTGNTTVDAILSSKILVAKLHKIHIEHQIAIPENLPIPQTDLCVILGNLLDNAIEACNQPNITEPYINVSIKKQKEMLFIQSVNSSLGKYQYKDGVLLSTKIQAGHGIGCKRISQIAEQLGGFSKFEPDETLFVSTVVIPLPD